MLNVYLFLIWTASFVSSAKQLNETCLDTIPSLVCNESLLCTTFTYLNKPNPQQIHLCSIPWKSELDDYVKLFTDEYTKIFLDKIENEFAYNFREYGDTILQGTTAVDENTGKEIIPSDEPDRKAAINDYLKKNFAVSVIEKFPAITKEAIQFAMGNFIVETQKKGGVTQTKADAYKTDMFKQMEAKSKDMLNVYVNLVWEGFKDEQTIQMDQMTEQHTGESLKKRGLVKWFDWVINKLASIVEPVGDRLISGFIKFGKFLVRVADGFLQLVKDGIKMVLTLVEGIEGFVNALAKGDISGAFDALGEGFTAAVITAVNTLRLGVKGIWSGMKPIWEFAAKVYMAIITMDPKAWIVIAISLVIGIALSLVFPPLAVALLGVTGYVATGVSVAVEVGLVCLQLFLIDPALDKAIGVDERPENFIVEGVSLQLNKTRDEYCYTTDAMYNCFNELVMQFCLIGNDHPPICADKDGLYSMNFEGTNMTFDDVSNAWIPPRPHVTADGIKYTYDDKLKQYCYIDDHQDKRCYFKELERICIIEEGQPNLCQDPTTEVWYKEENNQKFYVVNGEFITENEYKAQQ